MPILTPTQINTVDALLHTYHRRQIPDYRLEPILGARGLIDSYRELIDLPQPAPLTAHHQPIAHVTLVRKVVHNLIQADFTFQNSAHALYSRNNVCYSLLLASHRNHQYAFMLTNSHDQSLACRLHIGRYHPARIQTHEDFTRTYPPYIFWLGPRLTFARRHTRNFAERFAAAVDTQFGLLAGRITDLETRLAGYRALRRHRPLLSSLFWDIFDMGILPGARLAAFRESLLQAEHPNIPTLADIAFAVATAETRQPSPTTVNARWARLVRLLDSAATRMIDELEDPDANPGNPHDRNGGNLGRVDDDHPEGGDQPPAGNPPTAVPVREEPIPF